jgi:charged multivesicular body protein 3
MNNKHSFLFHSEFLATMKVAGNLQKSTDVMKLVNGLVKLPQIASTMQELQKEMMKAGIIEEMLEDVMDINDEDEIEEEAEEEVEKVLFELTNGLLGEAKVTNTELPVEEEEAVPAQVEDDLDDMKARLEALKY